MIDGFPELRLKNGHVKDVCPKCNSEFQFTWNGVYKIIQKCPVCGESFLLIPEESVKSIGLWG